MQLYPLFPLELVVYPLEELNLHIFEPRYRQLILDCEKHKALFGIPTFRKGYKLDYGTLVRLVKIERKYPDGRMDIRTEGVKSFRVEKFLEIHPSRLYPGGELALLDLDLERNESLCYEIKEKLLELYSFMNINKAPSALDNDLFYTTQVAHKVGFNFEQEYFFLQMQTELERQSYMLNHLNSLIPVARNMEEMRKKIQLNGHFKDILPPKV